MRKSSRYQSTEILNILESNKAESVKIGREKILDQLSSGVIDKKTAQKILSYIKEQIQDIKSLKYLSNLWFNILKNTGDNKKIYKLYDPQTLKPDGGAGISLEYLRDYCNGDLDISLVRKNVVLENIIKPMKRLYFKQKSFDK